MLEGAVDVGQVGVPRPQRVADLRGDVEQGRGGKGVSGSARAEDLTAERGRRARRSGMQGEHAATGRAHSEVHTGRHVASQDDNGHTAEAVNGAMAHHAGRGLAKQPRLATRGV